MKYLIFFVLFGFLRPLMADQVSLGLTSRLPTLTGAQVDYTTSGQWRFLYQIGFIPEPYAKLIGQAAAQYGGDSSYDDVVESALENNLMMTFGVEYLFDEVDGWGLGLGGSYLTSDGTADAQSVLAAATGRDYSTLIALLQAAGRSTDVDMKTDLYLLNVYGIYTWVFPNSLSLSFLLGVEWIMQADMSLSTSLPVFESSAAGQSLLRQSESDLEDIMTQYGVAPIVGFTLRYSFSL